MKAHLIARPESNWLVAENIVFTEKEKKKKIKYPHTKQIDFSVCFIFYFNLLNHNKSIYWCPIFKLIVITLQLLISD